VQVLIFAWKIHILLGYNFVLQTRKRRAGAEFSGRVLAWHARGLKFYPNITKTKSK
jgi:hypothetical protein